MAIWVEIHCDTTQKQRDQVPQTPIGGCGCYTDAGEMHGALGRGLQTAYKAAKHAALEAGWSVKRSIGWRCPACQQHVK